MRDGEKDPGFIPISWPDFRGEVVSTWDPEKCESNLRRVLDPENASRTIHWGRNYIYEAPLSAGSHTVHAVVKQFRNHGFKRGLERKFWGSKAERSWRIMKALVAAGFDTPAPVALIESREAEGNSYFVTGLVEPAFEVRHFFRRLNATPDAGDFPEVDSLDFLRRLGRLARDLHDVGIWYRDLSLGNVLVQPDGEGDLRLFLVDFNRAKVKSRLGVWRRSRDICRFPVLENEHREAFLEGYWGEVPRRTSPRWWLYVASVRSYLFKHAVKNRSRKKGTTAKPPAGGRHHPHIPAAEKGAAARDLTVWDKLSDQPHQHATKWQKLGIRLADAPHHLGDFATVIRSAPRVLARYRRLRAELGTAPVPFNGLGIALRPCPEKETEHLEAVLGLGVKHALVRLHPWQEEHGAEEKLVRNLVDNGIEVSFAIVQNRDLVKNQELWRRSVERLAAVFTPYGRHFQIGHAVNRSKWGVWSSREYAEIHRSAAEIFAHYPEVEILGPGVIDFEFQSTAAYLNRRGLHFDVVASLLYVDRRGAPENTQLGLDTVGKTTLLKAVCDTAKSAAPRSWITEVNWPLWEGPHSPAGRAVSVDEETQADYLVRYYLLALGTGLVERVYWWRLIARGYGLAVLETDGSLRLRPSYRAMKTLVDLLQGMIFVGPRVCAEGLFVYEFRREGSVTLVVWSNTGPAEIDLEERPLEVFDRNGNPVASAGSRIEVGPSPLYCRMPGEDHAVPTE